MASGDDYQTIWLPNSVMRDRATIPATTPKNLDALQGFMKTRYREEMADGRMVAELYPEDLRRVQDGYGCPNAHCLAFFNRRFSVCPICNHDIDVNRDVVEYSPEHWQPVEGRTSDEILKDRF